MAYGDFLIQQNLSGTGVQLLQHGIQLHHGQYNPARYRTIFSFFDRHWSTYFVHRSPIAATALVVAITAFISDAILINVMAEELPDKDAGRMTPFLAGIGIFVLVAMAIRSIPRIDI